MKRTGQDLVVAGFPEDEPESKGLIISLGGRAQEVVDLATHSINDVLQTTSAQVRGAVEQLKDTMKACEAKISAKEEIQVVVKSDQIIFSIKREFEFLKDK